MADEEKNHNYLFWGENSKRVMTLLLDFLQNIEEKVKVEGERNDYYMGLVSKLTEAYASLNHTNPGLMCFFHTATLNSLIKAYILPAYSLEQLLEKVFEDYNKKPLDGGRSGIEIFINYKDVLEIEKEYVDFKMMGFFLIRHLEKKKNSET